jgi:hypothetical protein
MNPPTLRQVLSRLHEENLGPPVSEVEAALPAELLGRAEPTPWFVRALVGFGAWIASWMFLGFLLLLGILKSEGSAVVLGLLLHLFALLLRRGASGDFLNQLALSANLLGQGLFIGGVTVSLHLTNGAELSVGALLTLGVSAYTVVVYPDRTQRFLSALAFGIAWHVLFSPRAGLGHWLGDSESGALPLAVLSDLSLVSLAAFAGVVLLARPRTLVVERAVGPVGYGLLIALLHLLLTAAGGRIFADHSAVYTGSVCAIGIGVCVIGLLLWLLREKGIDVSAPPALVAIGGTVLIVLMTRHAPGVIAAIAVLLIGFRLSSRLLLGLAILFESLFLSGFYYSLSVTLLQKSLVLLATGLLLIGLRFYVVRRPAPEAK